MPGIEHRNGGTDRGSRGTAYNPPWMDMDADSSSEVSDFSNFTDITERLWDSTDEEDAELRTAMRRARRQKDHPKITL